MFNQIARLSSSKMLASLNKQDLITVSENEALEHFISSKHDLQLPLSIRIISGFGALMSSLFFVIFMFVAIFDKNFDNQAIFTGIIFALLAILINNKSSYKKNTIKHVFLTQSSICIMFIGKILFVFGFTSIISEYTIWSTLLGMLSITIVTYHHFNIAIDRFLSTSTTLITTFGLLSHQELFNLPLSFSVNLFFSLHLLAVGLFLKYPRVQKQHVSLFYAIIISLFVMVSYFTITMTFGKRLNEVMVSPFLINIMLSLSIIALIRWIAGSWKKFLIQPLIMASLVALLLAKVSATGILFSICLVILGYAKYDKKIFNLGIILMPVFLFSYYYSIETNFLIKSGVLFSSGATLLMGRAYLAYIKNGKLTSIGVK